jgi:hypothetical protein
MLPGLKLEMLRRRSRIFSSARRPKRSQCSIFFSIQVSSTWVSATVRHAMAARLAAATARCRS